MLIEPKIYFTYFQLDTIDWLTSYRSSHIFSSFSKRQKFWKSADRKLFMFKSYTLNICSVIPAHLIIYIIEPIRCIHWDIAAFFVILLLCRYFVDCECTSQRKTSLSHSRFGHYFCSNLYGHAPRGPRGVKKSDLFFYK